MLCQKSIMISLLDFLPPSHHSFSTAAHYPTSRQPNYQFFILFWLIFLLKNWAVWLLSWSSFQIAKASLSMENIQFETKVRKKQCNFFTSCSFWEFVLSLLFFRSIPFKSVNSLHLLLSCPYHIFKIGIFQYEFRLQTFFPTQVSFPDYVFFGWPVAVGLGQSFKKGHSLASKFDHILSFFACSL